ncbi:MAG: prephenate dehydrogenase/arogenate dehydrogenase family protein [Coriobacteriales bacterium]|jgi:prephenate dehydrogenase|nr:prephenate dehydrogenase/arogenate dehydrogenase family protein [Coriobacteriales bacterium]
MGKQVVAPLNDTPSKPPFASVLIVGMGLIGGSIAAALKAVETSAGVTAGVTNAEAAENASDHVGAASSVRGRKRVHVRGIDIDSHAIAEALAKGFIDEGALVTSTGALISAVGGEPIGWLSDEETDLIVLAIPVSSAGEWFERIEASGYRGALTDVASTKGVITELAPRLLADPTRYIPGHPMAGSEVNGIEGARATLFANAHWILCPDEHSDAHLFTRLHEFVTILGARSITLPREEHDETIAVVSHVPHMVASALVQLAGTHARDKQEIFRLAAGGFKDTTRIAAGSPELWCGIALDNRAALSRGLAELRQVITEIESSLEAGDGRELARLLTNAARLRASIPSTWVPDSARLVEVRIPMANHSGVIAQVTGFAGKAGCNIQSIDIDHINEATAILELILTDEGDIGRLMNMLIDGGFDVSFRPLGPRE